MNRVQPLKEPPSRAAERRELVVIRSASKGGSTSAPTARDVRSDALLFGRGWCGRLPPAEGTEAAYFNSMRLSRIRDAVLRAGTARDAPVDIRATPIACHGCNDVRASAGMLRSRATTTRATREELPHTCQEHGDGKHYDRDSRKLTHRSVTSLPLQQKRFPNGLPPRSARAASQPRRCCFIAPSARFASSSSETSSMCVAIHH